MNLNTDKSFRILGVDPGTNFLGYAVIEIEEGKPNILVMGALDLQKLATHEKLGKIHTSLQSIIKQYHPQHLAIEAPFFGKNVQSMLKLGRAQGIVIGLAVSAQVAVQEYAPLRIKQIVTSRGSASKEQVLHTLNAIFNLPLKADQLLDESDALAVAYCHHLELSYTRHPALPLLTKKKKKSSTNVRQAWSDFVKKSGNVDE